MTNDIIEQLRGGLIVSCQAPAASPLCDPYIIGAMAAVAELNGAVGVRINSPKHIAAVRERVHLPLIGLDKIETAGSDVYITPTFEAACGVVAAGADIVALDATLRPRPGRDRLAGLIKDIQAELYCLVMADVATFDEGLHAVDCGADMVATTLCSYTAETAGAKLPAFDLIERWAARLNVPVICEGGVSTPDEMKRALDCGAFAVVVGTAITGIDQLVRRFAA